MDRRSNSLNNTGIIKPSTKSVRGVIYKRTDPNGVPYIG